MKVILIVATLVFNFNVPTGNFIAMGIAIKKAPICKLVIYMQLPRSLAVTMVMFVLLEDQMRGRGGWKCALEKCGELCVTTIGVLTMLVLYADSWDLKWMYQGEVSYFSSLRFRRCTFLSNFNHMLLAFCKKVVTYTYLM